MATGSPGAVGPLSPSFRSELPSDMCGFSFRRTPCFGLVHNNAGFSQS